MNEREGNGKGREGRKERGREDKLEAAVWKKPGKRDLGREGKGRAGART
jgi:hypothetical protein